MSQEEYEHAIKAIASEKFAGTLAAGMTAAVMLCATPASTHAQPCDFMAWRQIDDLPSGNGVAAYDTIRGTLVWFNGTETWECTTGLDWVLRSVSGPIGREEFGMAFDEAQGACVLFGGTRIDPDDIRRRLSDTWEWNGQVWTILSNSGPSARDGHRMIYDSANHRTLLFGGRDDAGNLNDIWAWSAGTWNLLGSGGTDVPQPRSRFGFSYDPERGRAVLYGGWNNDFEDLGDTWEFDAVEWARVQVAVGPPPLTGPAMAFDPVRHVTVLSGGSFSGNPTGETWEWNGTSWAIRPDDSRVSSRYEFGMTFFPALGRLVAVCGIVDRPGETYPSWPTWSWDGSNWSAIGDPALARPDVFDGALAYDSARHRTVAFGGQDRGSPLNTWEFDGAQWSLRSTTRPHQRVWHSMAYDSDRGVTVLYGGDPGENETWEWDGTLWRRVSTTNLHVGYPNGMAYDSDRHAMVLQGGTRTWEWNGVTWSLRSQTGPSCFEAAMAYHAASHRVVLFGGYGGEFGQRLADTWEWDGDTWVLRSPAHRPGPRDGAALCYNAIRQETILFGGYDGEEYVGDTWEWDGSDWARVDTGGPSARAGHAMAFDTTNNTVVLVGGSFDGDGTWLRAFSSLDPPTVTLQPLARRADPMTDVASFGVHAEGGGQLTYQWRKNSVPIVDDLRVRGSTTATLAINPVTEDDAGSYDVVISNACSSATSEAARLTVGFCAADFNRDALTNSQDFFDFLNAFFSADPRADFDGSGAVDSHDFFAFLEAFFAVC